MMSISKFRKLAGKEAENLTDKQIEEIIDAQCQFAELAFETWAKKKKFNKQIINKQICLKYKLVNGF